jgi:putative hemolysin
MRKIMLLCLATVYLITACSSATQAPTPSEIPVPSAPTPSIDYQIVGKTKNYYMVVVNPKSSTDRKGLQSIADYLCNPYGFIGIWFWDDINKAATSYPLTPDNEQALIAKYTIDLMTQDGKLLVYTLGDQ